MKKLLGSLLIIVSLFISSVPSAEAVVSVRGYYRSNGTYVSPHVRSNPNGIRYDNYSYSGGSLYNPSYYSSSRNYSSDWYTPSYYTDSSYYLGRSLYNSSSYYPSYSYSSYSP